MDIGEVLDAGREALAERPRTCQPAAQHPWRTVAGSGRGFARLRGPLSAAARADDATCGLGQTRATGPRHGSHVARAGRRHRHGPHRPDPALPARVRTGQRHGRAGMVVADEADAIRRGPATATADIPRRERQGAVRRSGRVAPRSGHAGPAALPADLRQRRARAQGSKPDHRVARSPGSTARPSGTRSSHAARSWSTGSSRQAGEWIATPMGAP
jgi:hypothetical protein